MESTRAAATRRERELASIVAFFLRETAARCRALSDAAAAETVRAELEMLVRTLEETLVRLRG